MVVLNPSWINRTLPPIRTFGQNYKCKEAIFCWFAFRLDRPSALVACLLSLAVFFSIIAGFYVVSLSGQHISSTTTTTASESTSTQSASRSESTLTATSTASSATTVTSTSTGQTTATETTTLTQSSTTAVTTVSSAVTTTSTVTAVTTGGSTVTGTVSGVAVATSTATSVSTVSGATSFVTTSVGTQALPSLQAVMLERDLQSSALFLAPICWVLLAGALVWRGRIRSAYSEMGFGSDVFELFMKMKGGATRIKVLNTLTTPKDRLQLAQELGVDWKTVDRHVQILNRYGFVKESSAYGTIRLYEVTPLGKMLLNLFDDLGDPEAPAGTSRPSTDVPPPG